MTNRIGGIRDTLKATEPIPVRLLSRAVLGRIGWGRRVAVLSAYFDGGGSVSDAKCLAFSVAGYVADDETWESVERDWISVLAAHGVQAMHAKDFAHSRGQFNGWEKDQSKRDAFMGQLIDVVLAHHVQPFSATLDMRAFRGVNAQVKLEETIGAYSLTAINVWGRVMEWHRLYRRDDRIIYLFEDGDSGQGRFKEWLRHKNRAAKEVIEPIFRPNSDCVAFQVSDLLAYEVSKMFGDLFQKNKRVVRQSIFRMVHRLVEPPSPAHSILESSFLLRVLQTYRVPPR